MKHYVETYGGNVARNAMVAAEWLAWNDAANGPRAFPSGALRATGMAAFTTSPFRSRSRWADDYYAIAEEVGHKCFMARRLDGARRSAFIADNRQFLRLCRWKTAADRSLRPFGKAIYEQGFTNRNASRAQKERYIKAVYAKRDQIYKRAYVIARNHLQNQE